MDQRIRIPIRNRSRTDLIVVVESWASELCLSPGEEGEVVLISNLRLPTHSVELCPYGLIFWAEEGTDNFELYKGGVRSG